MVCRWKGCSGRKTAQEGLGSISTKFRGRATEGLQFLMNCRGQSIIHLFCLCSHLAKLDIINRKYDRGKMPYDVQDICRNQCSLCLRANKAMPSGLLYHLCQVVPHLASITWVNMQLHACYRQTGAGLVHNSGDAAPSELCLAELWWREWKMTIRLSRFAFGDLYSHFSYSHALSAGSNHLNRRLPHQIKGLKMASVTESSGWWVAKKKSKIRGLNRSAWNLHKINSGNGHDFQWSTIMENHPKEI